MNIHYSVHKLRVLLTFGSCLATCFVATELRAELQVETTDNRVLRGEIDSKSSAELLWVRHAQERIVLTSSVAWSAIQSAKLDGNAIEIAALKQQVQQQSLPLAAETPPSFFTKHVVRKMPLATHGSRAPARIVSIQVDAILVNLDRDVEPDGLQVAIIAYNDQGNSVPVRGNLSARLWGQRSNSHGSPLRFEELQRWTQPVERKDFQDDVATFAWRFRTVRPEFDFRLWPDALLNVRLGVPGQGNYEASVPVIVRSFNPFRDRLQQYEGSRFLPNELSENVRRDSRKAILLGRGIRSR